MRFERLKQGVDFSLRAAFFCVAPFFVVFGAQLFPITGAIVQVALALLLFVAGEALRGSLGRSRLLAKLLSSQLEFEAHYREHAPRPFLYYVFYPLLLPYVLLRADTRREFLLYKGYTLVSFGLLLVSLVVQYIRAFPPELGLRDFIPIAAGTLLAESIVVLMFLMPIVTSVVHFHRLRAPRRLSLLLCGALVSVGFAAVRLERRREPIVSYATRTRVRLRTEHDPARARAAQTSALASAWRALPSGVDDVDRDGKIEAEPLVVARAALAVFYKADEADAFDLWYTQKASRAIVVLYFEATRGRAPMWVASDDRGSPLTDAVQLPEGAFRAMRHAAR